MKIENNYLPLLRIDAPEFYKDPAFVSWLNDTEKIKATWHQRGEDPTDWSDVFVTYCDGGGSDSDMPEHIWNRICEIVKQEVGTYEYECLIWISNVNE